MNVEYGSPGFLIRQIQGYLAIETARPHQRGVEYIRAIGSSQNDDRFVRVEAIHFTQYLVQGLLAFVMPAAQTGAPGAPHRIDFVDKNDRRRLLAGACEHVAHPRSADTDEHFDKLRAANAEEGYVGLAGDRLGHQGLTGARGAHQQNPLRDLGAELAITLRIFQVTDDFTHVPLGVFETGHVIEC